MDIWDLESRLSTLTGGSCETLDDLEYIPLDGLSHVHQDRYDILGLGLPSMELWDDTHVTDVDGFGFSGNPETPRTVPQSVGDSCPSSLHDNDEQEQHLANGCPPRAIRKHVKSVDDYEQTADEPAQPARRRYRKRGQHGRYATTDAISYETSATDEPNDQYGNRLFQRSTVRTASLIHTVRDEQDNGSTTNFFVCEKPDLQREHEHPKVNPNVYVSKKKLFPYAINKEKSSSCDELSGRPKPFNRQTRSQSTHHLRVGFPFADRNNSNTKGDSVHDLETRHFNGAASRQKQKGSRGSLCSRDDVVHNAYIAEKADDIRTMANVKVIATASYTSLGAHELSFKKGQKLKLKSHSMDGDYAFGWKRSSRLAPKKYGYFPLGHVKLYTKCVPA